MKLDQISDGFSWALRCFHSLSASNFMSSLQQEVLTPIHVILSDILCQAAMDNVSHEMDKICEDVKGQTSELAFFYSVANAKRRSAKPVPSSIPGCWLQRNYQSLEHYVSTESDYRRLQERSYGFFQRPASLPAPINLMLSIASTMILHSVALACACGLLYLLAP